MAAASLFFIFASFFAPFGPLGLFIVAMVIVAGLIVYVPFIYYKYQPPFMGKPIDNFLLMALMCLLKAGFSTDTTSGQSHLYTEFG